MHWRSGLRRVDGPAIMSRAGAALATWILCSVQAAAACAQEAAPGPGERDVAAALDTALEEPDAETARVVVRALQTASIGAELNARITYLPRREGDGFLKGDVLIEFDCRRIAAERDAAEAAMRGLEAAHQQQVRLLAYKSTGTASVEQALHHLEKARAELRLMNVRLESCRVLAPFDGRVIEKMAQIHEIAEPNQPLIKIINQEKLELIMLVPSARVLGITGAAFPVAIDETGTRHQARLIQSTGVIDPVSQSARVIAELIDPVPGILPGMSGTAFLPAAGAAP